jgi:hypothetical protein
VTLRGVLSAVAAIFIALLGPGLVSALWGINSSKATGWQQSQGAFLKAFSLLCSGFSLSRFSLCSSQQVGSAAGR